MCVHREVAAASVARGDWRELGAVGQLEGGEVEPDLAGRGQAADMDGGAPAAGAGGSGLNEGGPWGDIGAPSAQRQGNEVSEEEAERVADEIVWRPIAERSHRHAEKMFRWNQKLLEDLSYWKAMARFITFIWIVTMVAALIWAGKA